MEEASVQKAIEVLMWEHRLIEQALGSLEAFAAEVRAGQPPRQQVIAEYAEFFRSFADACHHGKEEDILFQRMIEHGLPRQAGPLAVMYYEHELGRSCVRTLTDLAADAKGATLAPKLLETADVYVPLLRQHIQKEDHVLYPMALQMLSGPELDAISTEFEAFEARMFVHGCYDRFRGLVEKLSEQYRPAPASVAPAAPLSHCCVR